MRIASVIFNPPVPPRTSVETARCDIFAAAASAIQTVVHSSRKEWGKQQFIDDCQLLIAPPPRLRWGQYRYRGNSERWEKERDGRCQKKAKEQKAPVHWIAAESFNTLFPQDIETLTDVCRSPENICDYFHFTCYMLFELAAKTKLQGSNL